MITTIPESEKAAIDALIAAYGEAWRDRDFRRWGALFTPDCDVVTWRGVWWTSRDENVAEHEAIPVAVMAQIPNYEIAPAKVRLLSDTAALVHAEWRWPGFVEAGAAPEDRRGLITMVLVKQDGEWRIRASQNSRITDD